MKECLLREHTDKHAELFTLSSHGRDISTVSIKKMCEKQVTFVTERGRVSCHVSSDTAEVEELFFK